MFRHFLIFRFVDTKLTPKIISDNDNLNIINETASKQHESTSNKTAGNSWFSSADGNGEIKKETEPSNREWAQHEIESAIEHIKNDVEQAVSDNVPEQSKSDTKLLISDKEQKRNITAQWEPEKGLTNTNVAQLTSETATLRTPQVVVFDHTEENIDADRVNNLIIPTPTTRTAQHGVGHLDNQRGGSLNRDSEGYPKINSTPTGGVENASLGEREPVDWVDPRGTPNIVKETEKEKINLKVGEQNRNDTNERLEKLNSFREDKVTDEWKTKSEQLGDMNDDQRQEAERIAEKTQGDVNKDQRHEDGRIREKTQGDVNKDHRQEEGTIREKTQGDMNDDHRQEEGTIREKIPGDMNKDWVLEGGRIGEKTQGKAEDEKEFGKDKEKGRENKSGNEDWVRENEVVREWEVRGEGKSKLGKERGRENEPREEENGQKDDDIYIKKDEDYMDEDNAKSTETDDEEDGEKFLKDDMIASKPDAAISWLEDAFNDQSKPHKATQGETTRT